MTGPCNHFMNWQSQLVRMNRELLENARETQQKYFHCEGAACFHNVDLWRKTSPAAGLGKLGILAVWRSMDVPESL